MNDLFQPVRDFEQRMVDFTGFGYGVAVESCSAAIFLCCLLEGISKDNPVNIPKHTYPSVPAAIVHSGRTVKFYDHNWQDRGWYGLGGTPIVDSAKYIGKNMCEIFDTNILVCLSFHHKKCLPIGRGGMILTDDRGAADWLRCVRHDGRHDGVALKDDVIRIVGWNFLMTPEQASRGIALMGNLKNENILPYEDYPDLSKFDIWNK